MSKMPNGSSSPSALAYGCCLCREILEDGKVKKGEIKINTTRPVVTTKCGHLFHTECLNAAFSQTNGNTVWKSKQCPKCRMTLTVATDLIRIFPSIDSVEEEVVGPSVEELQERTRKYESQIIELRDLLESSFIRRRLDEKDIMQLKAENEKLTETREKFRNLKSNYDERIESITLENSQLRNTVVTLSKNLAQMDGLNSMSLSNVNGYPRFPPPPPNNFMFRPRMYPPSYGQFQGRHPGFPHPNGPRPYGLEFGERHHLIDKNSRSVSLQQLNNFNVSLDERDEKVESVPEGRISNDMQGQGINKDVNLHQSEIKNMAETNLTSSVDAFMDDLLNGAVEMDKSENSISSQVYEESQEQDTQDLDKLYKKYFCDKCKAVWGTSRSVGGRPQICRKCSNLVFPYATVPVFPKN